MKQATLLLSTEDITVSEVAFTLGFTDLKYFRKCFKEQHGILPSDYRKQHYSNDVSPIDIKKAMNF